LASSRMRDDINLSTARAAHIRGIAAGFHLEFLDRVRRRTQILRVKRRICIGSTVQQEKVRVRSCSADHHGRALPRSPVEWICRAGLRAKAYVGAGNGKYEINQHAAVER